MNNTPQAVVRERFESKEALVDHLIGTGLVQTGEDESNDELKSRLIKTPNKKLLRLHGQIGDVTNRFGGRDGLIDALCKLKFQGRKLEDGWRTKLSGWSNGKLLDLHISLSKRSSKASATN
jgi:hypothetical protein